MTESFVKARELLTKSQTILLTTHESTDGDDLGTVLALALWAQQQHKTIVLVVRGGTPPQLSFLPMSNLVTESIPQGFTPDVVVYSGCSKKQRCNIEVIMNLTVPTINFDHHPDNTLFADVNVVDAAKSSVAELIYDFFNENSWPINAEIATCILTGIFTDTGSFMHSNTKQSTLRAAAYLLTRGASIGKIAKHTYRGKSFSTLKAWGRALENSYFDSKQKIIYSVITEEDLQSLGNTPLTAFEGFVETLNKVPDAKMALFLKQDGNTIKGSLRSDPHKGVNVQKIAKFLGGGGHVWASGFSVIGKLTRDENGKWNIK